MKDDIDALIEQLFPVSTSDIWRGLADLDFSFIIPPKARARAWKQRDITRAFKAAKTAGLNVRIDIAPDGKLSIIPVKGNDPPQPNEWDEVLGTPSDKVHPRLP
jgi:hypothetical protein